MMTLTQQYATRPRAQELFERNRDGSLAVRAIEAGQTLSQYLESVDPSDEYRDGTDAFTRQIMLAGIRTVSDPAQGIWADTLDAFDQRDARGLLIEFFNRRYREARFGRPANPNARGLVPMRVGERSWFGSSDDALNTIFRPYSDGGVRGERVSAALPLSSIVALQTGITSDAYRAAYMTEPTAEQTVMVRVGELGEIPLAHITLGDREIRLHKYARGFEISYEAMRRQRIDKITFWVQRAAIHAENAKFEEAISTLINGDGNNNAAQVYDLSDLDADADGDLTLRAFLAFKGRFQNDYVCDTIITTEALKLDLQLLDVGNANIPYAVWSQQFGGFTELNHRLLSGVALGRSDAAVPAGHIVGIDTSAALEHVMEIGSSISETQKFVTRQSDIVVMSEVEGFAVLDRRATRVLDTTA